MRASTSGRAPAAAPAAPAAEEVAAAAARRRLGRAAATGLALVAAAVVLHRDALGRGFSVDDPWILRCAVFEPLLGLLFDPEVYRRVSIIFFTPLQPLSFALDYAVAGLRPAAFYLHHVVALGLVACGVFAVVRRRGAAVAWLAAALFLVSGPAAVCGRLLMTRHYLEGAALALAAAWLLLSARGRRGFAVLAAVAYLAAMACKELYVPLGLALPWFLTGSWRQRLVQAWPILAALLAYAAWRLWMVGGLGGYTTAGVGDALGAGALGRGVAAAAAMLGNDPAADGSAAPAAVVVLAVAGAAGLRLLCGRQRAGWLVLGAAALLPMLLVWGLLERESMSKHRLVFHLAVLAPIAVGWAMPTKGRAAGVLLATGWAGVAWLAAAQSDLAAHFAQVQRAHEREVAYLWTAAAEQDGAEVVLVDPNPLSNRVAIAELRQRLRGESTPRVCSVPYDLRARAPSDLPVRYLRYSPQDDQLIDVTAGFCGARRLLEQRLGAAGFAGEVRVRGGEVQCELDKGEPRGRYFLLQGEEPGLYEAVEIPASARYRIAIPAHDTYFRMLRIDSGGGAALSPEWRASLARDQDFRW